MQVTCLRSSMAWTIGNRTYRVEQARTLLIRETHRVRPTCQLCSFFLSSLSCSCPSFLSFPFCCFLIISHNTIGFQVFQSVLRRPDMQSVKEIKLQLTPSPLYTLFQGGGCPENITCDLGGRILHFGGGRSPLIFTTSINVTCIFPGPTPPQENASYIFRRPPSFPSGKG